MKTQHESCKSSTWRIFRSVDKQQGKDFWCMAWAHLGKQMRIVCVCMSQSSLVSQNLKHSQAAFSSIHMGRYFRRKLNFSLMCRNLIFSSQTVAFSLSLLCVWIFEKFTVTKNAWSSVRLSYLKWVIWLQISQISLKVFTKNDLLKCRGIFSRDSRATSTCNSENSLHSNNFASHTFMFY